MRFLAFATGLAVISLTALIFAYVIRGHDLNRVDRATYRNCVTVEQLKAEILTTTQVSTGLSPAEKAKARLRFAPHHC